jgi:hypothetical protein
MLPFFLDRTDPPGIGTFIQVLVGPVFRETDQKTAGRLRIE